MVSIISSVKNGPRDLGALHLPPHQEAGLEVEGHEAVMESN